jgi:hypothetical protein
LLPFSPETSVFSSALKKYKCRIYNWDANYKFNFFLDMFLKIFEACFPVHNKILGRIRNDWITEGIKISCRHKRSQFSTVVIIHTRAHYNKYYKTLYGVIKEAKYSTTVGL